MARLPRGVPFTPNQRIQQANRIGARGRVNVRGSFRYNTRFPKEWSRDPRVRARFQELLGIVLNEARKRAPVVTGALRDSIEGKVTVGRNGIIKIEVTVGGRGIAPYWAFVEYGTGRRGAASRRIEPGNPVGWRYGRIAGQTAQPFMRPAMLVLKRRLLTTAGRRG